MSRFRALPVLALLAASTAIFAGQTAPAPTDLAARIQARYASVRAFTADFSLSLTSGLTGQTSQDRGKVAIKKPGRMRWTYDTGNRMEMVADGAEVYSYFPKDKIVHVTPLPKDQQASSALLLLMGRGDLTKDFIPAGPVESPPGEYRLTVKPRTPQTDFTTLTLIVDSKALGLRGLVVSEDNGGLRRYTFSNLKENQAIPDSAFVFKIPKGVEVQR